METQNCALFDQWVENWKDLIDFEIIPLQSSAEAAELMKVAGK
jgi:hypothetical protein